MVALPFWRRTLHSSIGSLYPENAAVRCNIWLAGHFSCSSNRNKTGSGVQRGACVTDSATTYSACCIAQGKPAMKRNGTGAPIALQRSNFLRHKQAATGWLLFRGALVGGALMVCAMADET
jgi:hypothetical protein